MAFERIEPWGTLAEEARSGMVCSVIANVNRKEGAQPYGPRDFSPILKAAIPDPEPIIEADPKKQGTLVMDLLRGVTRE